MIKKLALASALLTMVTSCSATYNITANDGTKSAVSGKLMNGAVSYSSGPGCTPTLPSPASPPPPLPTPSVMMQKQICDPNGGHCQMALMQAEATTPPCNTQIVNVHGNDLTDFFKWALGGAGIGFLLAK